MPPARLLDGLTAAQAEARVPGAPHSIAEIVAHLVFWHSWFLERCNGVAAPLPAPASAGWPAATGADWDNLREQFLAGIESMAAMASDAAVRWRRVDPAIEFPPLSDYSVGDAVTHVAVHNAHHLGQVVLLRQMMSAWPPPEGRAFSH